MFEEFANLLHQRYPSLRIEGDNYPPPAYRLYAAQFLSYLKLALLMIVVLGYNPFPLFNLQTPSIYNYAMENKVSVDLWPAFVTLH